LIKKDFADVDNMDRLKEFPPFKFINKSSGYNKAFNLTPHSRMNIRKMYENKK